MTVMAKSYNEPVSDRKDSMAMSTISYCGTCGVPFTHDTTEKFEADRKHLLSLDFNTEVQAELDRMVFHDTEDCDECNNCILAKGADDCQCAECEPNKKQAESGVNNK